MDWKILRQETTFRERFVEVERVELEIDTYDGRKMEMERYALKRPEVGAIVLYHPERDQVVLVEQFRYSSLRTEQGWVKEIVAGLIETGEERAICVQREAEEEAGFRVNKVEHINTFYPSWGFSDQIIYLYYATVSDDDRMSHGGGLIHETEDIKVILEDFDKALKQTCDGTIKDGKTILGIQWLALHLNRSLPK